MLKLTSSIGLNAEIFSAVDGRNLSPEQRARYDAPAARRVYGCDMSNSEIACYLSHFSIFEKIVAENIDVALVMEDDIGCAEDLGAVLEGLLNETHPQWSVVRLQSSKTTVRYGENKRATGTTVGQVAGRDLCRIETTVLGGCAYLIRKEAAAAMLIYGKRIFLPIDQTLDRHWENGILPFVVRPLPVWQSEDFASEIGVRGRELATPKSTVIKFQRRMQRLKDSFNKRLFWASMKVPSMGVGLSRMGLPPARRAVAALTGWIALNNR